MKKKITEALSFVTDVLEIAVSAIVLLAIALSGIQLLWDIGVFSGELMELSQFDDFLSSALGLVIGVEFIKMLIKHTPGAAIEVLLYAIARELVVQHTSTWETLVGILAIAAVFAIRKYLFISSFDRTDRYLFLASSKIRDIRPLRHVPADSGLTLGELLSHELELQGKLPEKDAFADFQGFRFRIASMENGAIHMVEITPENE